MHTCFLKRSAWGASTGSMSLIYFTTSSTVHRLGSWPLGLGLSRKLPERRRRSPLIHQHTRMHLRSKYPNNIIKSIPCYYELFQKRSCRRALNLKGVIHLVGYNRMGHLRCIAAGSLKPSHLWSCCGAAAWRETAGRRFGASGSETEGSSWSAPTRRQCPPRGTRLGDTWRRRRRLGVCPPRHEGSGSGEDANIVTADWKRIHRLHRTPGIQRPPTVELHIKTNNTQLPPRLESTFPKQTFRDMF